MSLGETRDAGFAAEVHLTAGKHSEVASKKRMLNQGLLICLAHRSKFLIVSDPM